MIQAPLEPVPSATVEVAGIEGRHPCDWEIGGGAFGLADWRLTANGRIEAWGEVRVVLRCPLGVLEGTVVVRAVERFGGGPWRTQMQGAGTLTLAGPAEEGPQP